MKSLRNAFARLALSALACAPAAALAEPASLSFADVYRLTVAGPLAAESASGAASNQSEALPPPVAAEGEGYVFTVVAARPGSERPQTAYQFSVGALPEPQHWLLLLSGLALAAWVARRRLFYSL